MKLEKGIEGWGTEMAFEYAVTATVGQDDSSVLPFMHQVAHLTLPDELGDGLRRADHVSHALVSQGATHDFPASATAGSTTEEEVWATLKRFQVDLQASESIQVVGGGASGVEYAAEVASQYPEKKVTVSRAE